MSGENSWQTERRTKSYLGVPVTSLEGNDEERSGTVAHQWSIQSNSRQTQATSLHSDGDEIDDDLPGAYAVSRKNQAAIDADWDPTDQSQVESNSPTEQSQVQSDSPVHVSPQYQEPSSVANSDVENVGATMDTSVDGVSKKTFSKRRCVLVLLAVVLCCGAVGAVVGVQQSMNKDRNTASSTDDCEASKDPFLQCECFGHIQVNDNVQDAYNSLRACEQLADFLDSNVPIVSCAPENVALVWVASEIATAWEKGIIFPYRRRIQDRVVIATLFAAWGGRDWKDSTNWLSSSSVCVWYGVGCDEDDKITSLSLPNNNVKGSLETRLALLQDLKTLDMTHNRVSGSIPWQVWSPPSLEHLFLGDNRLEGSFPANFGEFTTLKSIHLYQNTLTGSLPNLSGFAVLKELQLYFAWLTGTIPSDWGELGQIESLDVSHNIALSGILPPTLKLLPNLQYLDLRNTRLSGALPDLIDNMTESIEHLIVSATWLSGSIPTTVGRLTNLVSLRLHDLFFVEGSIPSELAMCTQLKILSLESTLKSTLESTSLTGTLPTELGLLLELKELQVSKNSDLSGTVPVTYEKLAKLEELSIFGTAITHPIPIGICNQGYPTIVYSDEEPDYCNCCSSEPRPSDGFRRRTKMMRAK